MTEKIFTKKLKSDNPIRMYALYLTLCRVLNTVFMNNGQLLIGEIVLIFIRCPIYYLYCKENNCPNIFSSGSLMVEFTICYVIIEITSILWNKQN